jgi:hypothetical protein
LQCHHILLKFSSSSSLHPPNETHTCAAQEQEGRKEFIVY